MSQHQIALLERALLIVTRTDHCGWSEMPRDLRISFARYMAFDVWTHLPDLLTLREAALLIVRDAIARTGEFSLSSAAESASGETPLKVSSAK
jgi:hypothetical protein